VHQNEWKIIISFIHVGNMNNFIVHVSSFKYLMCQHALLKINESFDAEVPTSFGYYGNNLQVN
jgi:hypothetical protein